MIACNFVAGFSTLRCGCKRAKIQWMDFYKCKTMNRDECRNNAKTIKKIRTCILVVGRSEIVFIFRVLNFLVYDSDWYPSVFSIKYTLGEIWLSAISIKNAFCISSSICLRTLHTNYDKILCCVKKWMFVFIYFTHKKYLKNNKILLRHFGLPFWTNCTTILLGQAYFFGLITPKLWQKLCLIK